VDARRLDVRGALVAPGYIDLQCNGGFGIDLASRPEDLWAVAAQLPRHGVTAWLPTIVSSPPTVGARALAVLHARPALAGPIAEPLGLHFEGPMLNPARRGAHPLEHLRPPSLELVAGWTGAAGVAMVTLAPELPGALPVIERLRDSGVVVAAGHTAAEPAELATGVAAGITYATHLMNAMGPIEARRPGPAAAVLATPSVVAGLIVDLVHVHPVTVAALWRALGPDRLNLVTDAVAALGMPDGTYGLGDAAVDVGAGGVRLADGTLAGSNLRADQAVRNLVAATGCTLAEAVHAITAVPARVLGLTAKGRIGADADADLVVLDDAGAVLATFVTGRLAFESEDAPWKS
jgi:N-acetylglucosamine-6-phosphate deacetylase